jgi:diguanylate cyclase (GGDEF)-like protein/PAS domain S-box-containing protein
MGNSDHQAYTLALLCNRQGIILQILRDDLGLPGYIQPGKVWTGLIGPSDLSRAMDFWQALRDQQAISGWELNVLATQGQIAMQFNAGLIGEVALLIATVPSDTGTVPSSDIRLAPATSPPPNAPRSGQPPGNQGLYEELVRLNNELAEKNRELEEKQHLLEKIFTLTPNASYLLDLSQDSYVLSNPSLPLLLGLESEQLQRMGSDLLATLLHPQDRSAFLEYLQRREAARDREILDHEFRVQRKDGKTIWLHSREWVFDRDADGKVTHILGAVYDVTDMHQAQEDLLELAFIDELTGLYNRAFLEAEIKRLEKGLSYPISFMVADVKGMQVVNEREGRASGDELLRQAGKVLRSALRAEDVVVRIESDEFAAVLPYTPLMITQKVVDRIHYNLAIHNAQHPQRLPLRMSIGIATANSSDGLANAFQQATERMYQDKIRRR